MDRVSIEKLNPGGLSGVRWEFFLLRNTLVVDFYSEFTRESKRHKPKTVRSWERLNRRSSTMKQEEVPFTAEVAREAKAAFIRQLEDILKVGFLN